MLLAAGKGQFWKLDRLIAERSEAQTGCPVTYSYSRTSGCQLLESRGFQVTDTLVDHIFPYSIPEYVRHEYRKVWYFRWMPQGLFRALERALGWHLCSRRSPLVPNAEAPYLSLQTARNDDHGGNLLGRMQAFVDGDRACAVTGCFGLIITEWNLRRTAAVSRGVEMAERHVAVRSADTGGPAGSAPPLRPRRRAAALSDDVERRHPPRPRRVRAGDEYRYSLFQRLASFLGKKMKRGVIPDRPPRCDERHSPAGRSKSNSPGAARIIRVNSRGDLQRRA
jgi:hypothetical protein